jgi:phytoene desaturase
MRVVIVGAGLGGLGVAVRLAEAGHRVTLLEKNCLPGGKMNLVEADGFRFDTGPSLITMPGVLADTFKAAGRRIEDYLTLEPLDPICRYNWPDGSRLDFSSHLPRLVSALRAFSPRDMTGFFRFLAYARTLYERAGPIFLMRGRPRLRDLFSRRGLDAARIDAHLSMDGAVRRFFGDPRLVQLFDRYATYNGSSPYQAPATLAMIPYIEMAGGGWYIKGGIYRLVEALMEVARELGVDFQSECEVAELIVECGMPGTREVGEECGIPTTPFIPHSKVVGVRLKGGGVVMADRVVVNADPIYAYRSLVPEAYRDRKLIRRLERLEPSSSAFVMLLGVKGDYPDLAHHNIFFSNDYRAEFEAIFRRREPAPSPTIYVANTSRTDPTQAPPGHSNLFVLVNAPALTGGLDWDSRKEPYRDMLISRLEQAGLRDLCERIVFEQVITPQDFEDKYNAWHGSIYGLSSNSRQTAFLRPPNQAAGVGNLYFVGGSVHPGGGIPLVLLSARLVARSMK